MEGLLSLVSEFGSPCKSIDEVTARLGESSEAMERALAVWRGRLVEGLVAVAVLFDPKEIRLGGTVTAPVRRGLEQLQADFSARLNEARTDYPPPLISLSALGEEAPAIGSACLLHQQLFAIPSE